MAAFAALLPVLYWALAAPVERADPRFAARRVRSPPLPPRPTPSLTGAAQLADRAGGWLRLVVMYYLLLVVALSASHTIKVAVSRPRPCFFAMCDYRGYRTAVASRQLHSYLDGTTPGAMADVVHCRAEEVWRRPSSRHPPGCTLGLTPCNPPSLCRTSAQKEITEAVQSFPSGHATAAFASCTFWALFAWRAASQGAGESAASNGGLLGWPQSSSGALSTGSDAVPGDDEESGQTPRGPSPMPGPGRTNGGIPLARAFLVVRSLDGAARPQPPRLRP